MINKKVPRAKFIEIDGIKFRKSNKRMLYNEEFCSEHWKRWTDEDLSYLVLSRPHDKWKDIAMALDRTQDSCMQKYYFLKKYNKIEYYKNLEL